MDLYITLCIFTQNVRIKQDLYRASLRTTNKQVKFQRSILNNKKGDKAFAQVNQRKRSKRPKRSKPESLGFVQVAKIK